MFKSKKNLSVALSAALLSSVAATAVADVNPFAANPLVSGYDVVQKGHHGEGKCGEGKCGESKGDKEGKCGEGKCGESKGEKEGKCGEGKCGAE
jgi:uncharacterized low-complexity protein